MNRIPLNEIKDLRLAFENYQNGFKKTENFYKIIKQYKDFEELTTYMLNEFIKKIIVHERDRKWCADTTQKVEIHFTFIGEYSPPAKPIGPKILEEQKKEQDDFNKRKQMGLLTDEELKKGM